MKVLLINGVSGVGSTGKICESISKLLTQNRIDNRILYYHGQSDYPLSVRIGTEKYYKTQAIKSRILGNCGFNSAKSTEETIEYIKREKPDLITIHNIHGHEVNIETLFAFLQGIHIPVVWTMHDCWAITGYCPHFTAVKCERWKTGCHSCPQRKKFSWFSDRSKENQQRKRLATENLNLTVVTPSNWLAEIMKESFLGQYPVKVIHNGIDLSVFQPTPSDFREKHGIKPETKLLLGVAFNWVKSKGLDVFCDLAKRLDNNYQIVLVGTNDRVDRQLPPNVISIHRTENQRELAKIYTAADVFVNPTREEVLGLVNVEALACGTPVITFDTGGSPECIDETCGSVVGCDDFEALATEIVRVCSEQPYAQEACLKRAQLFDMNVRFEEYVRLYCLYD